ncbi:MAG TPA: signal recognition particle-docking protein FtsY [Nitrososphaeraceae archaeon]|nr:signal recognition particle-docking protein FtsY [Nitrososphaeraceae archaeon]
MFEQLRKAFSSATRNIIHKELTEKDLNNVLSELEIALLQSDIAQEVIDVIVTKLKSELIGTKLEKEQNAANIVQIKFRNAIVEMFSGSGEVDLIKKITEKKDKRGGPFIVVFLGINGTGKTTTVAKVAHFLRKHNISVVLAAGDTHRAGAIEQISLHAEKLSLKVITQRYGADPSAVGRDAIDYAKKHHIDVVLVDTAGRMQTAKNLMDEINKIVRVVKPDIKLFVGDSLAGNDTINQAREFFEYTNFDGAILTKIDADAKGGSAISIVHITSRPIVYLGIGQGYEDIIPFDAGRFIDSILSGAPLTGAISPTVIEDTSSADSISADTQQMGKRKLQQLPEPVTVSGKGDISIQKADPLIQGEGYNPEQNKLKQPESQTQISEDASPTLENPSKDQSYTEYEGKQSDNVEDLEGNETGSFDRIKQTTQISPPSPSPGGETGRPGIINITDGKNKKTKLGGFFGKWTKRRNDKAEDKTGVESQVKWEDKPAESLTTLDKSVKSSKNKANEDEQTRNERPVGVKEETNDKHEGETVYLSDEDIEDMLK